MEAYFQKLLETRGALECALVYLAAQKARPEDGDKLRQPLSYAIARDVDYQLERDFDFHLTIADIADNDYLRRSLQSLMMQITEYLSRNPGPAAGGGRSVRLPALEHHGGHSRQRAGRAEQAMRSHMQYVTRLYSRELNRGHL